MALIDTYGPGIPYAVACSFEEGIVDNFIRKLKRNGFEFVSGSEGSHVLLVNLKSKKFGQIFYPVKYRVVGDKIYTTEEFWEIYKLQIKNIIPDIFSNGK